MTARNFPQSQFDDDLERADKMMSKVLFEQTESNIDFELMKKIHTQCQLEENPQNRTKIINPCFNHPLRPIKFICRDDQNGLCSECMIEHFAKDHNLISIEDQIKHVQTVLLNLEQNLQEILKSKSNILKKHEVQIDYLNNSKKNFLAEQKQKIESLKKYLDDRYLHIVCQYNIAYEKDLVFNKNKIEYVSEKIHENMQYIKKIQGLREEFIALANPEVSQNYLESIESKIIKNFVKTGKFLDYYNHIKEKNANKLQKEFKKVFPTHAQNSMKFLSLDVEREISILTKKFKDLNFKQESANQLLQKYNRPENNDPAEEEQKRSQKISIPRWFSKKVAEFDFEKDTWQSSQIKNLDLPIFPFSSITYSGEMNEFFVLGGYNNKVQGKSTFSSRVFRIQEEQVNPFESVYTAQFLTPMRKQRGCFPTSIIITRKYKVRTDNPKVMVNEEEEDLDDSTDSKKAYKDIFEGFVYAIGGKTREDKILKHCERYDLAKEQWNQIASLNESRMNSSACAFSKEEGIYVFGGEDLEGYYMSSIEQYSLKENKWALLELQIPIPVSCQVSYKVSKRKILLLGGLKLVETSTGFANKTVSSDVFSFNVNLGVLRQVKDMSLREPVMSLYPCFQVQDGNYGNLLRSSHVNTSRPETRAEANKGPASNGQSGPTMAKEENEACIFLINEGKPDSNPSIIPFSIKSFLPGGENY